VMISHVEFGSIESMIDVALDEESRIEIKF
jgi:hypothetical protein